MKKFKLQRRKIIARRASHELILTMAKYGNHYLDIEYRISFVTDADVKRFFSNQKMDFDDIVKKCREFKKSVPFFENLIGSTWNVLGNAKVSRVDAKSDQKDLEVSGPGTITMSTYWTQYEEAENALDQAIENSSFIKFHSALVLGIACIESYIRYRTQEWNKTHSNDLIQDSKNQKVTFDDKIDLWIPKMTGKRLDKSIINWSNFKDLRKIRDDNVIHSKSSGYSISNQKLAEYINKFKTGIAKLLVQLHVLFNEKIPSRIIRGAYAPDVEIVEKDVENTA